MIQISLYFTFQVMKIFSAQAKLRAFERDNQKSPWIIQGHWFKQSVNLLN